MRYLNSVRSVSILAFLFGGACFLSCGRSDDTLQGYVEADFIDVSSPLGGTLERLSVARGTAVKSGAALFTLERQSEEFALAEAERRIRQAQARLEDLTKGLRPTEISALEARVSQASAELDFASDEFRRSEELYKKRTISIEDRDRAKTLKDQREHQLEQAKAELETARLGARPDQIAAQEAEVSALMQAVNRARWNVEQKFKSAPEDGEVADTFFEPGEYVPAGRPVVRLLAPRRVKYRFYVPEALLSSVRIGQELEVLADGASPILAQVSFVAPEAEFTPPVIFSRERRDKLVFMIEGRPPEDSTNILKPGQPIEVRLK